MSLHSNDYDYLLSKISHEIRNPLALVYSTLQLIESQHPETKDFKYWPELRGDIEYMIQLLQEFSSFTNGERLHKTEFASYDFLGKICLSFAASLADDRITFSSTLPEYLPALSADKVKLHEVILNLLKNAKEAITEQGFIKLHAYVENNHLHILISDTGCGIPEEYFESLFDPFVTYKSGGTGLGLAVSKRIVETHGGNLHVESVVGNGTTFTITLPL